MTGQPSQPELYAFEQKLASVWHPSLWQDVTVLVSVSGGADSVALLRALLAVRHGGEGRLIAVHINHQLRGDESDADESFVVKLCQRLGVPCEVGRLAVLDRLKTGTGSDQDQRCLSQVHGANPPAGVESAARAARYEFLTQTSHRLGARYLATGHTADDQAETILHRILRGTGLAGLAGMARTRALSPATTLLRPLLSFRRAEVLEYLLALGQPYRQDSSNTDVRFTRNRLRHQLLPDLATHYNPAVVDALVRLGALAGEVQEVVGRVVNQLAEECTVVKSAEAARITLAPLAGQPRYIVRELMISLWRRQGWPLQGMGFAQWDQLAELAQQRPSADAKRVFPGAVVVERRGGELHLMQPRSD